MTDEQIVRALEQCASEEYCSGCSMLGRASVGYECMKKVMKDAAALIKRKEAEIEDLREIIFTDRTEAIKKLKADAVREFAERLKKRLDRKHTIYGREYVLRHMRELVKEMEEEK